MSQPNSDCSPSKSLRMITSLSGGERHNLTKKTVGCDSHVATREAATLEWRPLATRGSRRVA